MILNTMDAFEANWEFIRTGKQNDVWPIIDEFHKLAVEFAHKTKGDMVMGELYFLFFVYKEKEINELMKGRIAGIDVSVIWDGGMIFVLAERDDDSVVISGPSAAHLAECWALKSLEGDSDSIRQIFRDLIDNWDYRKMREVPKGTKINNPILLENLTGDPTKGKIRHKDKANA